MHLRVYVCAGMYVCVRMCVCVCMCVRVRAYVCVFIVLFVWSWTFQRETVFDVFLTLFGIHISWLKTEVRIWSCTYTHTSFCVV